MSKSFFDDADQFVAFENRVDPRLSASHNGNDLKITYIDWPDADSGRIRQGIVRDLIEGTGDPAPELRIIFAPLDYPTEWTVNGLLALFRHYNVHADFVTERLHSVTQACGTRVGEDGLYSSWFHHLHKTIPVSATDPPVISDPHPANQVAPESQSSFTWSSSAYFLQWNPRDNTLGPSRTGTTLICFNASPLAVNRLTALASKTDPGWRGALEDPYVLFTAVLDTLFRDMDSEAWNLAAVFRELERRTHSHAHKTSTSPFSSLPSNQSTGESQPQLTQDFVGLHNVAKHTIYLRESLAATLLTIEDLRTQHKHLFPRAAENAALLKYREGIFRGMDTRLNSLERRVGNVINLAFNLVTQQDSKIMQRDSDSMKTIAIMTLVFLPASTVAAMFGSQFFNFDLNGGDPLFRMSNKFWVFWVITLPVTVVVVVVWWWIHKRAVKGREGRETMKGE